MRVCVCVSELMVEAKVWRDKDSNSNSHTLTIAFTPPHFVVLLQRPLKAQLTAELAAAANEADATSIRQTFEKRERTLEHSIDHVPLELHLEMEASYNFLSR